jgi:general secretion pathway protein L
MAQTILGLDLGAHSVKAVLLEGAYRGYAVADSAKVPVPAGDAPLRARQAAAVRDLLAERGWRPDTVIAALPGAGVSSYVVTLPFADPRRIEQTLPFEVEGLIPFDLADVAWDWQPLGIRDGKSDLHVGVARREEVASLLAALAEAGIDPRAVVPAAPAYASLLAAGALEGDAAAGEGAGGAADVVLDVGHERTNACVVSGGACEAARTFAFGASQLSRVLARELGVSEVDGAAILAAETGGPPAGPELSERARDPRAAEALRRALAPLVRELRATLKAWQARVGPRPVGRVLLAGELARLPGLPELLAPEVTGPVAPLALAGPAAARIAAADAPALALALALALRGHQPRGARLNLRRGPLAYVRDFQHLRDKVVRLAISVAAILVLAVVSAGVKTFVLARQERALDRELCDAEQKILGTCYDNVEQAVAILKGRGTPTASVPKASAVDVLAELSQRIPADVPLRLDRIEVTREKIHLQGTTDAAENVDRIVSGLRGSHCFGDVRSGGARKRSSDGKFEFSVDSALTCGTQGAERG